MCQVRSFSRCDGFQQAFDLQHALSCKKGGLVTLRHNEIRDAVGDLASILWKDVKKEPVVKEPDVENGTPALIADLSHRGVSDRQSAASFDIRVTDTDAPSYQNRNPMNVLKTAEIEKKNKYGPACEEKHSTCHFNRWCFGTGVHVFPQTTSRWPGIKMGPPI